VCGLPSQELLGLSTGGHELYVAPLRHLAWSGLRFGQLQRHFPFATVLGIRRAPAHNTGGEGDHPTGRGRASLGVNTSGEDRHPEASGRPSFDKGGGNFFSQDTGGGVLLAPSDDTAVGPGDEVVLVAVSRANAQPRRFTTTRRRQYRQGAPDAPPPRYPSGISAVRGAPSGISAVRSAPSSIGSWALRSAPSGIGSSALRSASSGIGSSASSGIGSSALRSAPSGIDSSAVEPPAHILILNWNRRMPDLVRKMDEAAPPGSTVTVCMYTYMSMSIYIYIYVYVHVYICIYLSIYNDLVRKMDEAAPAGSMVTVRLNRYMYTYIAMSMTMSIYIGLTFNPWRRHQGPQ